MRLFPNVKQALKDMDYHMEKVADLMLTKNHQAKEVNQPMVELLHYSVAFPMADACLDLTGEDLPVSPNFPWAEDHFQERISGCPLNPGTQYMYWPFAKYAEGHRTEIFNHNYMERYWPKCAGVAGDNPTFDPTHFGEVVGENWDGFTPGELDINKGIRGHYGDLNDVINLLNEDINTRQAYLPIFFPEDTGNRNEGRKPCTLGYQFIVRNGRLDITYHIRSCDFVRHMADDIYMTIRLAEFVLFALKEFDHSVELGRYNMHITSLHMFLSDYQSRYKKNHKDAK